MSKEILKDDSIETVIAKSLLVSKEIPNMGKFFFFRIKEFFEERNLFGEIYDWFQKNYSTKLIATPHFFTGFDETFLEIMVLENKEPIKNRLSWSLDEWPVQSNCQKKEFQL